MVLFVAFYLYLTLGRRSADTGLLETFLIVHFSLFAFDTLLLIGFICHAAGNAVLKEKGLRLYWVIVLLLGNVVAMPIYWYHYVWKADEKRKGLGG